MKSNILLLSFYAIISVAYASDSYLMPDTSVYYKQCVGSACPTFSLPKTVEKPGTHHALNCSKGDVVPHPSECQSFYICNRNGSGVKMMCTFGYAFHPRIKLCVPESLVKSCGKVYCPPSIVVGTVPDPQNCTRYYRCVYGVPMHYQCMEGFVFDEELGKCMEHGENVPPCISGESGSVENNVTTENSVTTTTSTTTTPGLPAITTDDIITEEPIAVPSSSDAPVLTP